MFRGDTGGIKKDRFFYGERAMITREQIDKNTPTVGMTHANHLGHIQRFGKRQHKISKISWCIWAVGLLGTAEAGEVGDKYATIRGQVIGKHVVQAAVDAPSVQ